MHEDNNIRSPLFCFQFLPLDLYAKKLAVPLTLRITSLIRRCRVIPSGSCSLQRERYTSFERSSESPSQFGTPVDRFIPNRAAMDLTVSRFHIEAAPWQRRLQEQEAARRHTCSGVISPYKVGLRRCTEASRERWS